MIFDNEEDLSDYVVAPAHQAYLQDTSEQTLGMLEQRSLIYDATEHRTDKLIYDIKSD